MRRDINWSCGAIAVVLILLSIAFWWAFTDASSHQSVENCRAKMRGPILAKTAALPDNAVLRGTNARIEHELYGNENQARRLAKAFSERGWETTVEPQDEVGWAAMIMEDPATFRTRAAERVHQLCTVAANNNVQYRSWSINAPGIADYVSQVTSASNVLEELPSE